MNKNEVILRLIVTLTKKRLIGNEHGKLFHILQRTPFPGAQYQNTQTEQTVTITVDYFPRFLYSCYKLNKWIHAALEQFNILISMKFIFLIRSAMALYINIKKIVLKLAYVGYIIWPQNQLIYDFYEVTL